jgi:hypothetical protein
MFYQVRRFVVYPPIGSSSEACAKLISSFAPGLRKSQLRSFVLVEKEYLVNQLRNFPHNSAITPHLPKGISCCPLLYVSEPSWINFQLAAKRKWSYIHSFRIRFGQRMMVISRYFPYCVPVWPRTLGKFEFTLSCDAFPMWREFEKMIDFFVRGEATGFRLDDETQRRKEFPVWNRI